MHETIPKGECPKPGSISPRFLVAPVRSQPPVKKLAQGIASRSPRLNRRFEFSTSTRQTKGARSWQTAPRFGWLVGLADQKIAKLSTAPLMNAAVTAEATRVISLV